VGGPGTSARIFGHAGATGVLSWLDPDRDLSLVLLTTSPSEQSETTILRPVSALIASGP
jgi:CubicO group peptidase (beta-lactamase class C family)